MKDFYEAFINCPHKVLGKILKPFSLTHCLFLEAIESPFMKVINGDEAHISRKDLELAVLICSSENPLREISKAYSLGNFPMKFHSFKRGCRRFLGYLTDFVTVPELWSKTEQENALNAPWILSKATLLLTKTNITRREIWNMPLGELFWYSACIAEHAGVAEIQSEADKLGIEEALKEREKQ
jgi:hypothetical protein